jgi:hypothetical protein
VLIEHATAQRANIRAAGQGRTHSERNAIRHCGSFGRERTFRA